MSISFPRKRKKYRRISEVLYVLCMFKQQNSNEAHNVCCQAEKWMEKRGETLDKQPKNFLALMKWWKLSVQKSLKHSKHKEKITEQVTSALKWVEKKNQVKVEFSSMWLNKKQKIERIFSKLHFM